MTMSAVALGTPSAPSFGERIWRINWGLILVLTAIAGVPKDTAAVLIARPSS